MKTITILSLICIFTIFMNTVSASHKSILLRDVETVTLRQGKYTTGRRSSPVPQLNCVGGAARSEAGRVGTVQCYNRGFDGDDVNWECKSVLDKDIKLGQFQVYCEGFDYPDDPYVLVGSCGLEYELEYTGLSKPSSTPPPNNVPHNVPHKKPVRYTTTTHTNYSHEPDEMPLVIGLLMYIVIWSFLIYLIYLCIKSCCECCARSVPYTGSTHTVEHVHHNSPSYGGHFWDGWFWHSMLGSGRNSHTNTTTVIDNTSRGGWGSSSSGSSWGSTSSGSGGSTTHTSSNLGSTKRR